MWQKLFRIPELYGLAHQYAVCFSYASIVRPLRLCYVDIGSPLARVATSYQGYTPLENWLYCIFRITMCFAISSLGLKSNGNRKRQ